MSIRLSVFDKENEGIVGVQLVGFVRQGHGAGVGAPEKDLGANRGRSKESNGENGGENERSF